MIKKLLAELDQSMISRVEEKPTCIHNIFCVNVVEFMERGDFMSTVDLKNAYCTLSIHPSDRPKQGLVWNYSVCAHFCPFLVPPLKKSIRGVTGPVMLSFFIYKYLYLCAY